MKRLILKLFYVYILYRADGITPMYIGKGRGDRWLEHEIFALNRPKECQHNPRLYRAIRKIVSEIGYLPKEKVAIELTEREAFKIEKILIKILGRNDLKIGPLLNLTDGGFGGNLTLSPEILEQKRMKLSLRKHSPETIAKIVKANTGQVRRPHTEETKRKIAFAIKGRTRVGKSLGPQSEEHLKKRVESRKGYKHSEETIEAIKQGLARRREKGVK